MPFNWNDQYIESKADKNTDILGFGEIGGVGQLIYHNFRFAHYIIAGDNDGRLFAHPVCDEKNPPDITPRENLTGKDILTSLCDLARRIDDFNEPLGYLELIGMWCKENMHPYAIDSLYDQLTEENFELDSFDAELVANDGVFPIDDFMTELGKLYNAARLYIALEAVCFGNSDSIYDIDKEGRHFEGLPYFEKYKLDVEETKYDRDATHEDLLAEMQSDRAYRLEHPLPTPQDGYFATEPYDDYEKLRKVLTDCIPDFKLRLKVNPLTNRLVFSADVYSVFDIAWYTLARMLTEDPAPENVGNESERPEGIMICCSHCGRFFIRNARHQQYCDHEECQKARNAKNQRDFRRRKAIERAQAKKQDNGGNANG